MEYSGEFGCLIADNIDESNIIETLFESIVNGINLKRKRQIYKHKIGAENLYTIIFSNGNGDIYAFKRNINDGKFYITITFNTIKSINKFSRAILLNLYDEIKTHSEITNTDEVIQSIAFGNLDEIDEKTKALIYEIAYINDYFETCSSNESKTFLSFYEKVSNERSCLHDFIWCRTMLAKSDKKIEDLTTPLEKLDMGIAKMTYQNVF